MTLYPADRHEKTFRLIDHGRAAGRGSLSASGRWWLAAVIITLLLFSGVNASAQETEESDVQAWFQYEYRHAISPRLRGSWGLGYRELVSTEDVLGEWSRLHLRGNFSYAHRSWVTFEGGIGGFYTFSSNLTDLFELRAWQGAVFFWPTARIGGRDFDLRHRLRLEQRWTRQRELGETDFELRLRYRLATFIPLNGATIEESTWYVPIMGEAFGDLGGDSVDYFAERLRLTTGLGHVLSDRWTLEFRYTAQKSFDTVQGRFETTDHVLDLRIRTAVRIKDLMPSLR